MTAARVRFIPLRHTTGNLRTGRARLPFLINVSPSASGPSHNGAASRRIIEPINDDIARRLGEALNSLLLSHFDVFGIADIGGRGSPHVTDDFNPFPPSRHYLISKS